MNDRRSIPRSSPHPCPHCAATRLADHHFRDAGELSPDQAIELGYCPTLAARRTNSTPLHAADERLLARIDAADAGLSIELLDLEADLYAEAVARALTAGSSW